MMFVIKTLQQLEDAIDKRAEEVMIVGDQAPEIIETIRRAGSDKDWNKTHPKLARLKNGFEVISFMDNNQQIEGNLRMKNNLR